MSLKKNVEQYNRDIEAGNSYGYTEESKYSAYLANKRVTNAIFEYIRSHDNEITSILDIGCGDGTYTNQIKLQFPAKEVAGFDPAARAIGVAQQKFPGVRYFVADAEEYRQSASEKPYDLAILSSVLHHTAHPDRVVRTVSSYADRILIIDPNGYNPVRKLMERTCSYYIEHEEVSYTSKTIRAWCEAAGYHLDPVRHYGFVPLFFPTLPAKIIWFFTPVLEKIPGISHCFSAITVVSGKGTAESRSPADKQ